MYFGLHFLLDKMIIWVYKLLTFNGAIKNQVQLRQWFLAESKSFLQLTKNIFADTVELELYFI